MIVACNGLVRNLMGMRMLSVHVLNDVFILLDDVVSAKGHLRSKEVVLLHNKYKYKIN